MFVIFFSQHRRFLAIVAIFVILAAIGGAIAWQQFFRLPSDDPSPTATGTPPVTTPPSAGSTGSPQAGSGQIPPQSAPAYTGIPVQTLNPDPDILKQVPADTYEKSRNELAELAVSLASNPRDTNGWVRVAFIKRFYGDYDGTADAYEYLNVIAPGDALPFVNLAGLYGYYLKQPAKAIPKYEAAIRLEAMNPAYYVDFANFYREVAQDLPAAERVLEQGLAKVPTDPNLLVSYAVLSQSMGQTARAIEYYEKALASATLPAEQRRAITADVNRLKAQNP